MLYFRGMLEKTAFLQWCYPMWIFLASKKKYLRSTSVFAEPSALCTISSVGFFQDFIKPSYSLVLAVSGSKKIDLQNPKMPDELGFYIGAESTFPSMSVF